MLRTNHTHTILTANTVSIFLSLSLQIFQRRLWTAGHGLLHVQIVSFKSRILHADREIVIYYESHLIHDFFLLTQFWVQNRRFGTARHFHFEQIEEIGSVSLFLFYDWIISISLNQLFTFSFSLRPQQHKWARFNSNWVSLHWFHTIGKIG